jgi:hypothetical protein
MKCKIFGHTEINQAIPHAENIDVQKLEAELKAKIAIGAYYRAKSRGFVPGHELDDWLGAENEILPKERQPLRIGLKATLIPHVKVDLNITE